MCRFILFNVFILSRFTCVHSEMKLYGVHINRYAGHNNENYSTYHFQNRLAFTEYPNDSVTAKKK